MFMIVKYLIKIKLFLRKIWWIQELFVLLHSLLRNTLLASKKKRVL